MANAAPPPPGDNDDTVTPVDLVARRPASQERKGWGSLEAAVAVLALRIRQFRQEWDTASPNHRRFLAEKAVPELRDMSATADGLADDLEDYAQGVEVVIEG